MLKKIALLLMLILPISAFAQKFGHIKTQEILTVMPEYTKAQTDIQTMQQQYDDEMKRLGEELNERGMQMQQDAQQQLQQSWMQMLEPIAKKIDDAIKAVGQEGGYVYIFDLNATQIPFVNETLSTDVTGAVKAKLGL